MHHMPDVLSRMFKTEDADPVAVIQQILDEWYVRCREAVISNPHKYHG